MESPMSTLNMAQLRCLIGSRVHYEGAVCEIIEVLEDGPALILQYVEDETASEDVHVVIQPDQHGEAHRRVPTIVTVPILSSDGSHYHPTFLQLNVLEELNRGVTGAV